MAKKWHGHFLTLMAARVLLSFSLFFEIETLNHDFNVMGSIFLEC